MKDFKLFGTKAVVDEAIKDGFLITPPLNKTEKEAATRWASLHFSLPDEQSEFNRVLKAGAYVSCLYDLHEWVRGMYKYSNVETIKVEELREKLISILNEHGVDVYE